MDMNVVMTGDGRFIEVQCTAEGKPFGPEEHEKLTALARQGINTLFELWQEGKQLLKLSQAKKYE